MADFRDSGDDDALPPPGQQRDSLPGLEAAAMQQQVEHDGSAADNASSAKQSGEGGDGAPPAQGPLGHKEQPPRPGIDPALAKQVNDVMASEVTPARDGCV